MIKSQRVVLYMTPEQHKELLLRAKNDFRTVSNFTLVALGLSKIVPVQTAPEERPWVPGGMQTRQR